MTYLMKMRRWIGSWVDKTRESGQTDQSYAMERGLRIEPFYNQLRTGKPEHRRGGTLCALWWRCVLRNGGGSDRRQSSKKL